MTSDKASQSGPASVGAELHVAGLADHGAVEEWDRQVAAHRTATPFHSSGWISCLEAVYGFRARLYVLNHAAAGTASLLPLMTVKRPLMPPRLVSLPFSDYGGPLARENGETSRLLSLVLGTLPPRERRIEIRGEVPAECGFSRHCDYKRHVLDLRCGRAELLNKIDRHTVLYSIRKAERTGVSVTEENTMAGVSEFYRLNLMTRAKHGVPSQPLAFFQHIFEQMPPGVVSILLARHHGLPIAAGFFLRFKQAVYYKYNASDPACLVSKTPNHLLTWSAIRKACEDGFQEFDFGRSSLENTGLCRYKEMWGARGFDLPYSYYPAARQTGSVGESGWAYRIFTTVWRRLPPRLQNAVGPRLYRYVG